jgi:hypothetical protein
MERSLAMWELGVCSVNEEDMASMIVSAASRRSYLLGQLSFHIFPSAEQTPRVKLKLTACIRAQPKP